MTRAMVQDMFNLEEWSND
jgi:hypothetical protein